MAKRIFIGFDNSAGYGSRLLQGFRKAGIDADQYVEVKHPFNYDLPGTKLVKSPRTKWGQRIYGRWLLLKCLFKYDAFIFVSVKTFIINYKDLPVLRFFGKKTVMILIGCDFQQPELTASFKYSSCHECNDEYKKFVNCVPAQKPAMIKLIEARTDFLMTDRALAHNLTREFIQTYQPINLENFPAEITMTNNKIPVILHAPSNPAYKGTKYFLNAVEKLKKEYEFEYKLVRNVKVQQLYEEIQKSDIVVDQLIQGWFGLLPLEAMMLGRPVICYMRDDLMHDVPSDCPIVNANPVTIYDVLKRLLNNRESWQSLGEAGRNYVVKYHDAVKVAKFYQDLLLK